MKGYYYSTMCNLSESLWNQNPNGAGYNGKQDGASQPTMPNNILPVSQKII